MIDFPNPPSGDGPMMDFLRRLLAAARACRMRSGVGYKVRKTSDGTFLEIETGGGGPAAKPLEIHHLFFNEMKLDYIVCTDDQGKIVNVAKPPLLRFSVTDRRVHPNTPSFATTLHYTDYSLVDQTRIAHFGGILGTGGQTELQVIVDSYEVPDTIYAVTADAHIPSNPEINLIDLNVDGRYWAAV